MTAQKDTCLHIGDLERSTLPRAPQATKGANGSLGSAAACLNVTSWLERTTRHNLSAGLVRAPVGHELAARLKRAGRRLLLRDETIELADEQALARREVLGGQPIRARLALKVFDEPARLQQPGVGHRPAQAT